MLNSNYVVGLVDGEGSFTIYIRNPDNKKIVKRRVKAEPRFYLKLIEKDKNILYQLKNFFGCGNVYFQGDKRKNHQDCYRYEVANRNDLMNAIIPVFKKHPLNLFSKKKDFRIFCKMMGLIMKGVHLKEQGQRRLYEIKQKMH
jgi:hypothetical protein